MRFLNILRIRHITYVRKMILRIVRMECDRVQGDDRDEVDRVARLESRDRLPGRIPGAADHPADLPEDGHCGGQGGPFVVGSGHFGRTQLVIFRAPWSS